MCDLCWEGRRQPDRVRAAVRVKLPDAEPDELCCFCGALTRSGIYTREMPEHGMHCELGDEMKAKANAKKGEGPPMVNIDLSPSEAELLEKLGRRLGYKTAAETLHYVLASLADGVRRPGAWESQVVLMLFGG
jgi:hypothetical protein